jgi:hypothetical protein
MPAVNTVTVWHANNPTWRTEDSPVWDARNYTMVAIIDPNESGEPVSLDDAYRLTNHIDRAWWENEGVNRVGSEPRRSTSVGDVIFRNGTPYRVASFGFDEIRKEAPTLGRSVGGLEFTDDGPRGSLEFTDDGPR